MTVTGQVHDRQRPVDLPQPRAELLRVAALVDVQVDAALTDRIKDRHLLSLKIQLGDPSGRRGHEGEAEAVAVGQPGLLAAAETAGDGESRDRVLGEKTALVGQQLEGCAKERPLGPAGRAGPRHLQD